MSSARHELDRLSSQAWGQLATDCKSASRSMGRVGLSYARRHPALLLGGGALLGAGAVAWFAHPKSKHPSQTDEPIAPSDQPRKKLSNTKNALMHTVKKMAGMWIADVLTTEFRVGASDDEDESDGKEEAETNGELAPETTTSSV